MKLDIDLMREILLQIEEEHQGPDWELPISSMDYSRFYVAEKLAEKGLIRAHTLPDTEDDSVQWMVIERMTVSGHEFLESIRDPKAWKAVKAIASKIGNSGIGILMDIAQNCAKEQLGL